MGERESETSRRVREGKGKRWGGMGRRMREGGGRDG